MGEWHFSEWSNWVSDLVLAGFFLFSALKCGYFQHKAPFFRAWTYFFWCMAASAFLGAWAHLLVWHTGLAGKWSSWSFTVLALVFLESFLWKNHRFQRTIWFFIGLKALVFSYFMFKEGVFKWVIADLSIGLLGLVCGRLLFFFSQTRDRLFLQIVAGICTNGFAGAVHASKKVFTPWLDANDVAHGINILAFLIVLNAVLKLSKKPYFALDNERY